MQMMDVSRLTIGVDVKEHDDACVHLIREVEKLQLWFSQARPVDIAVIKKQIDKLHALAQTLRTTYPTVITHIERLHHEIQTNESILAKRSLEIEKLQLTVTDLRDEVTKMSRRYAQTKEELETIKRGALRRQIAINIEYEVKYEMLTALGQDNSEAAVSDAKLWKVRNKVLTNGKEIPGLSSWLGFQDAEAWNKFMDAMAYMKVFSHEAHPTTLDGKDVDDVTAAELVDEDFDTSAVRRRTYPWDDALRTMTKEMIHVLKETYRDPGQRLLYNSN
jgi:hypothetical protein